MTVVSRTKIARCDVRELHDVVLPQFRERDWEEPVVDLENRTIQSHLAELWTSGTEMIEVYFLAKISWTERDAGILEIVLTVSDEENQWSQALCEDKADELLQAINDEFASRWHPYRNLVRRTQLGPSSLSS